ncbi:hypothetical protein D187_003096 [Cystobacter fuscus DSM 2262]|uniref:Uncharacterized protein n=1 Tax=Cystobacter fuscus (strain ATCC 25194 / DSM 2262 / NBRC 100088 / M29) TaxID=1242864 RepID=S9PAB2_CYSF2|nr:hypothetical protein [Cystobacter fuscus]EPX59192.1 hypothetical protein D187_003096 [Cystobacter fuscus DSM 2262]
MSKQDLVARQKKVARNYSYQTDLRNHLNTQNAATTKGPKPPVPVVAQPLAATVDPSSSEARIIPDAKIKEKLEQAGLIGSPSNKPQSIAQGAYMSGDRNAICASLLLNDRATVDVLYTKGDAKESRDANELKKFYVDSLKANGVDEATASGRVKLEAVDNSHETFKKMTEAGEKGPNNEFALAQITKTAEDLGKKTYLVGDPIGQETADKNQLMSFWDKMPEGLQGRTHQLYAMTKLRDKGCIMVGMRSGALEPQRPLETLSDLGEGAGPMRATRDDRRQLKAHINSSIDQKNSSGEIPDKIELQLKTALANHDEPSDALKEVNRADNTGEKVNGKKVVNNIYNQETRTLVGNTAEAIKVSNAMKSEIEQRQFQKEELDHLQGSLRQFFGMPQTVQPPRSE